MAFDKKAYMEKYVAEHKTEKAVYDKQYYKGHKADYIVRNKKWREEHPKEYKAHADMNTAIVAGRLVKPAVCSNCNRGGKIEGHHEDYDKPLEIVWLCIRCHNDRHVEIRRRYDRKST